MKKLLPILAASLAITAAATGCGKKKVFKLDSKHEAILNKYAGYLGQTKEDCYSFLKSWYKDETEIEGMNFFEDLIKKVEAEEEITKEDIDENFITQSKNVFYFCYLYTEFAFNFESDSVDEMRCLLDHYMGIKYTCMDYFTALEDELTPGSEEAFSFADIAYCLYTEIKETAEETFEKGFKSTIVDFRRYLDNVLYYVPGLNDRYTPFIDKFATLVNIPEIHESYLPTSLENYLDPSKPGKGGNSEMTIIGFKNEDTYGWEEGDEAIEKAYQTSFNSLLYFVDMINDFIENVPEDYNGTAFFLNNLGPVSYKILDIIEAYQAEDKINVDIIASEIVVDSLSFYEFFLADSGLK